MNTLQLLYAEIQFRLSNLTWVDILDLLLVTLVFYLLLALLRRSRAAFLVRGALALGVILFVVTILLPLSTFDWLVRAALIAMFIATPVIFQPELRRFLERVGRTTGLSRAIRQTAVEQVLPQLVHTVENLSASRTGALIALEGNASLNDIAETGIPMHAQVSGELLQAIFYEGNPLHDGGIILRDNEIIAASCLFPLTERSLVEFERRLGTRHRAAVGLTETCDTLVIVVSEETGAISIARNGELYRPLDIVTLREHLYEFYVPSANNESNISLWRLIKQFGHQLGKQSSLLSPRYLLSNLSLLFVSILLAVVAWWFVLEQTNPTGQRRFNLPLRIENVPSGTALLSSSPANVSAMIQTTNDMLNTLSADSFQAVVSLKGLEPGLHHLPVQINTGASQVRVLVVTPAALDFELAPIITHTMPVVINFSDSQSLPPAYEMVGEPMTVPEQVEIIGPAPIVDQVNQIQTSISLANATSSVRETRPIRGLDEQGREIAGITLQPDRVQVNVTVRRRLNAVDVGVRAITSGTPPTDYWLSSLTVTPSNVTLQGDRELLTEINGFVETLPVDISEAVGDIKVDVPLNLPLDVQALDSAGNIAKTVTVSARITPRSGDLLVTRPVELVNISPGITTTVLIEPRLVDVLLSGPLPTLNQIESNPNMVRVLVDGAGLTTGQSAGLAPNVVVPEGVRAQLAPPSVLVTIPKL